MNYRIYITKQIIKKKVFSSDLTSPAPTCFFNKTLDYKSNTAKNK